MQDFEVIATPDLTPDQSFDISLDEVPDLAEVVALINTPIPQTGVKEDAPKTAVDLTRDKVIPDISLPPDDDDSYEATELRVRHSFQLQGRVVYAAELW